MENKELNDTAEITADQTAVAVADEVIDEFSEAVEATTEVEPVEAPAEEQETIEESDVEKVPEDEVPVDVVDEAAIQAAEETEAEKITVAPIGEAPEIKVKEPGVFKKAADFFTSVRWQRAWDKISFWLLLLLFALPIAALVYILSYFF